jgi:hypothetical protein
LQWNGHFVVTDRKGVGKEESGIKKDFVYKGLTFEWRWWGEWREERIINTERRGLLVTEDYGR